MSSGVQRDTTTVWGRWANAARQIVGTPLVVMGSDRNPLGSPVKAPAEVLRRIDGLARAGLQRLQVKGVKYDDRVGELHAHFDHIQSRPPESPAKAPTPTAGAVADVPLLGPDPRVTRAVPLQRRVKELNFNDEGDKHLKNLARKVSALTALMQMRDSCGIKEADNLNLLRIVAKATKEGTTETLWDLFTNHRNERGELVYDLSLYQKFKAGWRYWAGYQTSLIDNTVEAYLRSFAAELKESLTSEQTLTRIIRDFLEDTNDFFIKDAAATTAFVEAKPPIGDVEKYRMLAIEAHYGNSLEKLCQEFSKTVVNGAYTVPIGRRFQEIRIIKWLFQAIEWFVNRFIIRRLMKSSILPPVLVSVVKKGVEATAPHNLPFSLELTRFLNKQIDYFRDNPSSEGPPVTKLPGTEKLPETIKNLKIVLDLELLKTKPELERKLLEIKNGKGFVDKQIEDVIQEAIVQASHKLFEHLRKMAQSGELSCKLLELSCAPFSDKVQDQVALMAEFKEEQLKLEKGASDLFEKFIDAAVTKIVKGPQAEDAKELADAAEAAFEEGKAVAKETFDELNKLCVKMTQKIDHSARAAAIAESSVETDIAVFLQRLLVLVNRKKLQDRIEKLNPADRDAIYRQVAPFYERVAQLAEKVLRLQELQDEYPTHTEVANELQLAVNILALTREQFQTQPRHHFNSLIQTLKKTHSEIGRLLDIEAPAAEALQGFINSISRYFDSIAIEQQVIDAIHKLSPPRTEGQEAAQEGLLEKLLKHDQGVYQPEFQERTCLRDIDRYLDFLPKTAQEELRELIGNGFELRTRWDDLGTALKRIHETHEANKVHYAKLLDGELRKAKKWAEEILEAYSLIKDKDHTDMQKVMGLISTDVKGLYDDAFKAKVAFPISLSVQGVATAVGAAAGLATGCAGPLGVGLGAASSVVTHSLSGLYDLDPSAWGKSALAVVAGRAATGAVASFIPGGPVLLSGAGGALAGMTYAQAAHTNTQNKVLPPLKETFKSAYALATGSDRLAHAFATRLMETWIRAKA